MGHGRAPRWPRDPLRDSGGAAHPQPQTPSLPVAVGVNGHSAPADSGLLQGAPAHLGETARPRHVRLWLLFTLTVPVVWSRASEWATKSSSGERQDPEGPAEGTRPGHGQDTGAAHHPHSPATPRRLPNKPLWSPRSRGVDDSCVEQTRATRLRSPRGRDGTAGANRWAPRPRPVSCGHSSLPLIGSALSWEPADLLSECHSARLRWGRTLGHGTAEVGWGRRGPRPQGSAGHGQASAASRCPSFL